MGRVSGIQGAKKGPRHRRPKHSAAAVQTRPAMDLCRHSHSVHRPGDPSLCVQCACAHPQPELPFPLLHGIEVRSSKRASSIDITLPVDRNPPPRDPLLDGGLFSFHLLPSRSTVAPIAPATTSSSIVKRNLRPFNPPRSSSHFDSHLRLPPPAIADGTDRV